VEGNSVVELINGGRIFPAMLEAIRGARRTITFETYIHWSGSLGEEFAEALSERARAGVKVHVSFRLNDEANLNLLDRDFAQQLTRTFEADMKRSRPISFEEWRNRPGPERIVERILRLARSQMHPVLARRVHFSSRKRKGEP
jgi:phosphatidylserine/phosphatidylglycerophosphate/cardiolipin synthase-like enzyme